jgi:N-methylhydantoinase A
MKRVLVPRNPASLCAMGLLLTDLRADFADPADARDRGLARRRRERLRALAERAEDGSSTRASAQADRRSTAPPTCATTARTTSSRSPLPEASITPRPSSSWRGLRRGASPALRLRRRGEPVQIVTLRLEATGLVRKAELRAHPEAGPDASGAVIGQRAVWLPEARDFVTTPIYSREALAAGNRFAGPAIVEQMDATTVVPPGMTARVDAYLNLILEAA